MSTGFPSLTHERRAFPLPTVSEDTLVYNLHLPPSSQPAADESADATALATLVTNEVNGLLPKPWLWNKDAWELKVVPSATSPSTSAPSASASADSSSSTSTTTAAQASSKLEGRMRVGDAVDDEWAVVWLLTQVSQSHPELAISIRDNDGEFLLIEAAHQLPSWVSPENATNRFWLMGGHFHLLPLSFKSEGKPPPHQISDNEYDDNSGRAIDPSAWISEDDALRALRADPDKYRVDKGVEAAIEGRISKYPAALKTHLHHAKAYLPEKIARALSADPSLVQKATEAFYVRDPAQLRQAARMTSFPPQGAILTPVLMTRTAYAQLRGQVFHPPRAFGAEWHVPESEGEDEARWRDLGVKISTGFEILYREGGSKRTGPAASSSSADLAALRADPEYERYISDLRKAGFFGEEREGSAKWQEQEAKAAKGWKEARSKDNAQDRPSFAYLVDSAVESTRDQPTSAFETNKVDGEDDDAWLAVDPHELDALMARAAGGRDENQVNVGEEDGKALADLAEKMQAFVGGKGDLGGARFADDLDDEDMDTSSDSEDENAPKKQEPEPELTERQRQERLAALVQPLDASEWGQRTQTQPDIDMDDSSPGLVAGSKAGDAMLPTSMRPPRFEKQEYDGVISESSDDDSDTDLGPENSIGRKVLGMRWADGAPPPDLSGPKEAAIEEIPSDEDEEDHERKKALELGDIDEEMNRRVWGLGDPDEDRKKDEDEGDVDMDDEEGDFLEFSRQALGLSDEQWADILRERKDRGAYVPSPSTKKAAGSIPPPTTVPKAPAADAGKTANQSLNSFESMMKAMEDELARHMQGTDVALSEQPAAPKFTKPAKAADKTTPTGTAQRTGIRPGKGKATKFQRLQDLPSEADLDDMDDEQLAAMDAELRRALGEHSDDEDDMPELDQLDDSGKQEYGMMRNFLESYRSQAGQSGPVGNLFGRLGEEGPASSGSKK